TQPDVTGYSITNPACITNGDTSHDTFIAGAVVNGRPVYWWSQDSGGHGNINLTRKAATAMYTSTPTKCDVCFSYTYGVTVVNQLTQLKRGTYVGDTETWEASIFNTTPYLAKNANLRAYLVEDGVSKPVLVATTRTDIGPVQVGWATPQVTPVLGQGVRQNAVLMNTVSWQFSFPLPDKNFKVLVTANLNCDSGLGSSSVPEPLVTVYAYGSKRGQYVYGQDGKMETALFDSADTRKGSLTGSGPSPYDDNFALSTAYTAGARPGQPGGGGGGGGGSSGEGNLAALSVSADVSGKVTADFSSTFNLEGWAVVRFYREDKTGTIQKVGDDQYVHFTPGGKVTVTQYNLGFRDGDTVWAAIDMSYSGGQWAAQEFSGADGKSHPETTYA
ncbi:MAG: hypothetical protein ACPLSX_03375, partial [Arcobacter sp.]